MLKLLPKSLPPAQVNQPYLETLTPLGAYGPCGYRVIDGELPLGLNLGDDGRVWGTPDRVGISVATIEVRDARDRIDARQYTISVNDGVAVGTRPEPWPLGAMAAVREDAAALSAGKTLPEVEVAGAG